MNDKEVDRIHNNTMYDVYNVHGRFIAGLLANYRDVFKYVKKKDPELDAMIAHVQDEWEEIREKIKKHN